VVVEAELSFEGGDLVFAGRWGHGSGDGRISSLTLIVD
jgi:hypothetical protein